MKTLRGKEAIETAVRLQKLVQMRRDLEKQEKEAKAYFKSIAGDENVLKCGDLLVMITEKTRTGLDKKALIADQGQDFVNQYTTETVYKQIDIKDA